MYRVSQNNPYFLGLPVYKRMILKITSMGYDRNLNHNVENNHKEERGGGDHMICLKTHCLLIIFFLKSNITFGRSFCRN